jgi:hypothetical protein
MKVPISYDLIKDLGEALKSECLLAFCDFCLDLFEEEFSRIPQEETNPQSVKGLLIRTK